MRCFTSNLRLLPSPGFTSPPTCSPVVPAHHPRRSYFQSRAQMLSPPHKFLVKTALEEKDLDLPASWLVFMASLDLFPFLRSHPCSFFLFFWKKMPLSSPPQPYTVFVEACSPSQHGYGSTGLGCILHLNWASNCFSLSTF